jgi:hypothetical protein
MEIEGLVKGVVKDPSLLKRSVLRVRRTRLMEFRNELQRTRQHSFFALAGARMVPMMIVTKEEDYIPSLQERISFGELFKNGKGDNQSNLQVIQARICRSQAQLKAKTMTRNIAIPHGMTLHLSSGMATVVETMAS